MNRDIDTTGGSGPGRAPRAVYLSRPGLVCCAGAGYGALFAAALRGEGGGIVPVTVRAGGGVRRFLAGRLPPALYPDAQTRLAGLCAAALEQIRPAAEEALRRWGPGRVGVCAGSCDNGTEWSVPAHRAFFEDGAFPSGYRLSLQGAAGPAEFAAAFFGVRGPALALATACASGATAIIRGAELIRAGICDAVIAGGADLASDTVLLGFSALEAVSPERCNPFSKNRKGITLGEGAAFFVLSREPLEAWGKPGDGGDGSAVVLAGWGESADAFHMTAPDPEGRGAAAAMTAALESADIGPEAIGYVNLHGTGTPLNDSAEAAAMTAVFGSSQPPASSSKPVTGHTLGAAGALEAALCWALLESAAESDGTSGDGENAGCAVPLHCWDGEADETLPPLNLAGPGLAVNKKIRYCMSNSFAFGGCNVSLVLGREK